jgi:hypothetical protein
VGVGVSALAAALLATAPSEAARLRVELADVLAQLCAAAPQLTARLPSAAWAGFVDWFFAPRHGAILLARVRALLAALLRQPQLELAITFVLVRCKFVERLAAACRCADPALATQRAFAWEAAQMLRVAAELQGPPARGPVSRLLDASEAWRALLPEVRAEALRRVRGGSAGGALSREEEDALIGANSPFGRALGLAPDAPPPPPPPRMWRARSVH